VDRKLKLNRKEYFIPPNDNKIRIFLSLNIKLFIVLIIRYKFYNNSIMYTLTDFVIYSSSEAAFVTFWNLTSGISRIL